MSYCIVDPRAVFELKRVPIELVESKRAVFYSQGMVERNQVLIKD